MLARKTLKYFFKNMSNLDQERWSSSGQNTNNRWIIYTSPIPIRSNFPKICFRASMTKEKWYIIDLERSSKTI
jgi:hypothetical protein